MNHNEVRREDYRYCETCGQFIDLWKYDGSLEDAGHGDCKTRAVTQDEFFNLREECTSHGCFEDHSPESSDVSTDGRVKDVLITVIGGVAEVMSAPAGVRVWIRDYDNGEGADIDTSKRPDGIGKDGKPYWLDGEDRSYGKDENGTIYDIGYYDGKDFDTGLGKIGHNLSLFLKTFKWITERFK